jgi:serine protease AprX
MTQMRPTESIERAAPKQQRPSIRGFIPRFLSIILIFVMTVGQAAADGLLLSLTGSVQTAGTQKTADTQKKGRIAPDLKDSIGKRSLYEKIRVVVNLTGDVSDQVVEQIKGLGGEVLKAFKKTGQLIIDIPAGAVESLTTLPGLDYIAPDRPVDSLASHIGITTGANQVYRTSGWDWSSSVTGSLQSGFNGSGVTVAVLDSGVDADMTDLKDSGGRRTLLSMNLAGSGSVDDPYGHGTHVAGIIAGNGSSSLKAGYDFTGIAPGANLVNYRVLDDKGHGSLSTVISAIDLTISTRAYWGIRVINLSLAAPPVDSYKDDPLCRAVDRAVQAGLVVVAAAGNYGLDPYGNKVYGGITSPGICPSAITVGAAKTQGTAVRSDDVVAPFSSRGPTRSRSIDPVTGQIVYDNLPKPDLVAPGTRIVSLEHYNNAIVTAHPELHVNTGSNVNYLSRYMLLSGTSMATPVVSGTVALMLQANPSLNPTQVRAILMYSAQIMEGADLFEQGAGLVNIEGAVRTATSLSRQARTPPVGATLTLAMAPRAVTTIAGETFAWDQALIWGGASVSGVALVSLQQAAYAQTLIWGSRDASVFGAGVTWSDGLFNDSYVVFGKNGQWSYITWDTGTLTDSGALCRPALYASGAVWQNSLMTDAFYTIDPATLIWGYLRYCYDLSLIWATRDSSLIWNSSLIWSSSLIWGVL